LPVIPAGMRLDSPGTGAAQEQVAAVPMRQSRGGTYSVCLFD
jgi:hypothetical protein